MTEHTPTLGPGNPIYEATRAKVVEVRETTIVRLTERNNTMVKALLEIVNLPDHADLHEAVLIAMRALPEDLRS